MAIHKPAIDPSKIKKRPPTKPTGMSWRTKAGIFAGTTAVTGTAAYLAHHYGTRRNNVKKFYDPFLDQEVSVEKKFGPTNEGYAVTGVRRVSALVPTGKHVSHANKVHFTGHGKRTTKNDQAVRHISR